MDTSIKNLLGRFTIKLKQASFLWLDGFREACCLHRVIIYCLRYHESNSVNVVLSISCLYFDLTLVFICLYVGFLNFCRSRELAIRTGQCFLLNGFIFLGSIFVLRSAVIPTLQWVLPDGCPQISSQESCSLGGGISRFYSLLRLGLVQLFYVFWFYPMYIFSFILSALWYNDIAKYGFFAIEKYGPTGSKSSDEKDSQNTTDSDKATDLEGVMIGIAEQVYSVLLLSFFFVEVYVTGFIPYTGKALNFLLLSWMKPVCSGSVLLLPPCELWGYGYTVSIRSEADKVVGSERNKWKGAGLGRIPIFVSADYL
ncbi:hypothetical protein RD792_001992, partial [Penstemon davidsonii]